MSKRDLMGPAALTFAVSAMTVIMLGGPGTPGSPDGSAESEQVSKLLFEARTHAVQLREDASMMEAYSRYPSTGWESHADAVEQMKEHINATGRLLTRMENARASASPWQDVAMDRIKPLLKEIATNTERVIKFMNSNPKRLMMPQFKEYIETNADTADKLAGLITDFVDYGKTKNKLEQLTARLELSEK